MKSEQFSHCEKKKTNQKPVNFWLECSLFCVNKFLLEYFLGAVAAAARGVNRNLSMGSASLFGDGSIDQIK